MIKLLVTLAISTVILMGLVLIVRYMTHGTPGPQTTEEVTQGTEQNVATGTEGIATEEIPALKTYASAEHSLTFLYSPSFFLYEKDAGTPEAQQKSITLVSDTEENRALITGTYTGEPREGPTLIMIDIYQNPKALSAQDWIQQDTNWGVRVGEPKTAEVNGITVASFAWDGLYQGKTFVAVKKEAAYVFSATWTGAADPTLKEFDTILQSVQL